MVKTKFRVMAFVLSLVMMLSLAACNKPVDPVSTDPSKDTPVSTNPKETESTESTAFDPRSITEGVTLRVAVESDDEVIDWNTNQVTLMIEEKFGVDLRSLESPKIAIFSITAQGSRDPKEGSRDSNLSVMKTSIFQHES